MIRLLYLVIFALKSYWRKTKLITQFVMLALLMGVLLNPSYAPYNYDYIVLVKNYFFIIVAFITTLHLSRLNYNRELYVILNRVKRSYVYLSSIISSILITGFLGVLLDVYIVAFLGVSLRELFNISFIMWSFINLLLVVSFTHLFSRYIAKSKYLFIAFIFIVLASIPNWYQDMGFERMLSCLAYLFPPIGLNILEQRRMDISLGLLLYSLFYLAVAIRGGFWLINKSSFSDLD